MKIFKKTIAFLVAISVTSANFAFAEDKMGADDLMSRSIDVIKRLNNSGSEFLDSNGQLLSPAIALKTRDFYMKNSDSNLYFRAKMTNADGLTTIALGVYDKIGGNRLAARTVAVDTTKSHAENNLLIDQTIQNLGQQIENISANNKSLKHSRSVAAETNTKENKLALPFISLIKSIVGISFLIAAFDLVMDWENLKGAKLKKAALGAGGLALAYVILDRYFTDAH